jgi:hypothetical protein
MGYNMKGYAVIRGDGISSRGSRVNVTSTYLGGGGAGLRVQGGRCARVFRREVGEVRRSACLRRLRRQGFGGSRARLHVDRCVSVSVK